MISRQNRRDILERVRAGELAVSDAVALMGTAAPGAPAGAAPADPAVPAGAHEVVAFTSGWERTAPTGHRAPRHGRPPLIVLDPSAARRPGIVAPGTGRVVEAVAGPLPASDTAAAPMPGPRVVQLGDDASWERLWAALAAADELPDRIVLVTAEGPEHCLDVVYPAVRTLIRGRIGERLAVACLAVGEDSARAADALGGFCSIAAQEDSRLHPVAVSADGSADPVALALEELAEPVAPLHQVRHDAGGRWVRTMTSLRLPSAGPLAAGVHLLSGGGGGIALSLAELLARTPGARIVLLGRSHPGTRVAETLRRVNGTGTERVRYVHGDVTRPDDVRRAVAEARAAFGPVTDVLHLAGVNEDAYIANKAPGAHARVLAPKLAGARHLDEATRDEPLRHFVLFSSLAGYAGHPGQADYAAASRALGGFAAHRAALAEAGRRSGHTVSVGWPLWAGGGMTLSDTDRRAVEVLQGMVEMPPDTGLAVMTAALRSEAREIVVVHGHRARIEEFVRARLTGAAAPGGSRDERPAEPAAVPAAEPEAAEAARTFLLELVSRLTRIAPGRLRSDQEFSALGIDSVMIRRLTAALEDRLGPMPVTLLFEHRTVDDLTDYLVAHHRPALTATAGTATAPAGGPAVPAGRPAPSAAEPAAPAGQPATPAVQAPVEADTPSTGTGPAPRATPRPAVRPPDDDAAPDDAVAVIGLAGRYPGARDVTQLWRMLVEGRDAIGEIPPERWDKERWFDRGDRRPGTSYGRWGGFLDDVARFDSLFFSVAPREARRMDPAERLFLEVAWSALEDAGYTRARLHRTTRTDEGHAVGVFVGTTGLAYGLVGAEEWGKGNPVPAYSMEFSLANRLSYFLDVHGPSLTVDTACSASLTALHLACESLRRGECRTAVVGGAHLNLHPMKYAMLAEQRMISPDGVCRAFGDGGNGFVPGEGVGAVVLKPLAAARADGDRVDAVIRATAISHGGHTNGYTVPSPRAHASVIAAALRRSGIDPASIGYVEAHGTGTELGDPIEIEGLARVFGRSADEGQYCALGSVKPNIGHAEAAAGIAGLTKVLLQLRHRTLAPTLHSDPPNPKIDFAATPFRLQRTAEPWHPRPGHDLRRAALSSFGAGGANAHAVIEEYRDAVPADAVPDEGGDHLVVLSARTPDRLKAAADRLARFLTAPDGDRLRLDDITHTLQTGREAFEHRVAFVVPTRARLVEALSRYVTTGAADAAGHVAPEAPRRETADARGLFAGRRLHELAARWVAGEEFDWPEAADRRDRHGRAPRAVPLPTYPFVGPVHWPDTVAPAVAAASGRTPVPAQADGTADRAPLAELGVAADGAAEFVATLTRDHPWVADHLVDGRPVLAGVAHLALARAAAQRVTGRPVTELSEVRWRTALVLDADEQPVVRALPAAGDGAVRVEIGTGTGERRVVHATVTAWTPPRPGAPPRAPKPLDIASVRLGCPREVSHEAFYDRARAAGLDYGPSYRRVERLWCGEGEALAELAEPAERTAPPAPTSGRAPGGIGDPGVTDAALHAVHGAVPAWEEPATLPAAVDRVRLHSADGVVRHAHARLVAADAARGTVKCDVLMTDAEGRALVEFTGLTVVRPSGSAGVPHLVPVWRVAPRLDVPDAAPAGDQPGPALVLTAGHDAGLAAALVRHHGGASETADLTALRDRDDHLALLQAHPGIRTLYFAGGVDTRRHSSTDLAHLEYSRRHGCLALFHLAQALAELRPRGLRLVVLTSDSQQPLPGSPVDNPFAGSLHGMARTLSRELPFLDVVCLDLARTDLEGCRASGTWAPLVRAVAAEPAAAPFTETALREGTRLVKRLAPAELPAPADDRLPLRRGGRYLVVGGLGGLGRVVGEHLLRDWDARLVVMGRRPERHLPDGTLARLRAHGGQVEYLPGDVTDPAAARAAVRLMHERYGGVDGAVHTAFVLADRTIPQSDDATFDAAFAPKTRGTVALADALTAEPLDFFALFSSAIAHTGNPGQSNYAAGSTFMSSYGAHLATRLHWPVTVVDWGFWGDEGAVATPEHRERLARWGVQPLTAAEGLHAFRQVLAAGLTQVAPLRADLAELGRVTPLEPGTRHRRPAAHGPALAAPAGHDRSAAADGTGRDVLAAPAAAVMAAQRADGEPYAPDYLDAVDDYARLALLDTLREATDCLAPGAHFTRAELLRGLSVHDERLPLFDALLASLKSAGHVRSDRGRLTAPTAADADRRHLLRHELLTRFVHLAPTLDLLDDCAAALPDVLARRRRGLDVLFPGGSDRRMAALYADDPRTRHFNRLTATAVRAAVTEAVAADPARRVRILEIGAGTGATTRAVLDAIDDHRDSVSYHVTDISPSLVAGTRRRLADGRPHTDFRVLDIADDPATQGFDGDRYDIVVATNVLHATRDMRRTLRNVAELTATGGLLAVNEATRVLDAVTPVFGLTDGWWLAGDAGLRLPHGPLLAPATWQALLAEAGFDRSRRFGVHGWTDHQAGQHLFVAERGPWRTASPPAAPPPARREPADRPVTPAEPQAPASANGSGDRLLAGTTEHLRNLFADLLRLPPEEVDPAVPLASLGTDSLTVMEAVERLERDIGPVPRELLVTGESVRSVAQALVSAKGTELAALTGAAGAPTDDTPSPVPTASDSPAPAPEEPSPHPTTARPAPEPVAPAPTAPETAATTARPAPEPVALAPTAPETAATTPTAPEPIAVVGIAGRYPGAADVDTLWEHLLAGRSLITPVPPGRWSAEESGDGAAWGGFLDDVDRFDPLLFRISPREAERMDPAERLFLETAWEALEDAALPPSRLRARAAGDGDRTGVFVGVMHHQYALLGAEERGRGNAVQALSSGWSVANRVSHTFGLTGPSMAVDTACSSALTAVHLAVRSLRDGECGTAIAGGVNVILHPSHHADLAAARMLSPHGTPRVFDTAADGIVTGEGVGALVLKRLSDALRDGDRVHACIRGSAVNADGPTEAYAVPRAEAQVDLITQALRASGADARTVQYVEAQATGSPVGDPVELAALREAYGVRADGHRLRIGSVKPNTGHLEAASGVVQLTKVILQLRHRTLAPTLGTDGPPTADGFLVPREPVAWPEPPAGEPRRAAVSSFGAGGANAHVVLEGAPRPDRADDTTGSRRPARPLLLLLSARRPDALRRYARRLAAFLEGPGAALNPVDVTHTLRAGREPLTARLGAVVHDLADIVSVLTAYAQERPHDRLVTGPRGEAPDRHDLPSPDAEVLAQARRWMDGEPPDGLAAPEPGARIVSLPHYPFSDGRYWLRPTPADHGTTGPAPAHQAPAHPAPADSVPVDLLDPVPTEPVTTSSLPVDPAPSDPVLSAVTAEPLPPAIGSSPSEELSVTPTHPTADSAGSTPSAVHAMRHVVTEAICALVGVTPQDIDPGDHLSDFGLDSVTMVQLADRLSRTTGADLTPDVLYGCRDMAAVVDHLVKATATRAQTPAVTPAPTPALAPAPAPADDEPQAAVPAAPGASRASASASTQVAATAPASPAVTSAPAGSRHDRVNEPVAVVGMSGSFPGSPDLDSFWNNLVQGRDLISEAPSERFAAAAGTAPVRGGFLDGVDRFDAGFFQITPREARVMDPQARLFLQTVWAAVEEAGYDPADLAGSACGLFVGVASSEYGELARERGVDVDGQLMTGNDHSVLANRVSFLLDLRGPSEPVDTACSSALVAVHRAVRAIQTGECDLAVAGGVNVIVAPTAFEAFGRSGMLAPDGRCKSFDHRADGYVRGEGVGAVLLKPLSRALADGDHVHGVIAGSATNHGGRAASLTAPNPAAQAEVISLAQRRAGARPETIGYVEAHGTGTALGDPIEVTGLRTAFETPGADGTVSVPRQYCGLGSVKTNIGHLETAAGMAGLFKVLLSLRHGMLPPTLHVERVNPLIRLADSPFHLVTSARPWTPFTDAGSGAPLPRRAGVSSFGFGGMNAHLVVEEAPAPTASGPSAPVSDGDRLFVLSARDDERLLAAARRLLERLERWERDGHLHAVSPDDVAYTLQVGRRPLTARLAVAAPSLADVADALRTHLDGGDDPRLTRSRDTGPRSADEDDLSDAVRRAVAGDFGRLAALWAAGADVDWRSLHATQARARVSLPTYPFAPEQHWLPPATAPTTTPRATAQTPAHRATPPAPAPRATAPQAPTARPAPPATATPKASPAPKPEPTPEPTPAPQPARTATNTPAPQPVPAPPVAASASTSASASATPDLPDRLAGLRQHVREAVADGIGIAPEAVDPARDFASYGVDSIGAMRIMQTVQDRYGDHIPMAAILEHPSVDRLVVHLDQSYVLPDAVPETLDAVATGPARKAQRPLPAARPSVAAPRLVPLTGDRAGDPVYCLFGDTGELTWVMHLCGHLAEHGPVTGVEAPGFPEGADPAADINLLARACADAIGAAHPGGSCRLAGHGVAGLVAVETARILQDRGLQITELLLVQTPGPGEQPLAETGTESLAEVAAPLAGVWGADRPPAAADLAGLTPKAALDRVTGALGPSAPMDADALRGRLERAAAWRAALVAAAAVHHARPLGGLERTVVVRAVPADGGDGGYHRWIAPPPDLVDLDVEPWLLVSAGNAARVCAPPAAPEPAAPPAQTASPVVAINRHGDNRRSVWAHNLYGEVSYAIYLSRHLGLHNPVIGLEQIGAAAADRMPRRYDSVEDMAAHYVGELRDRFPGEPYLLGGCSFGGVLAYEMTRQLQLAGEEVTHLIAIDPIMPGTEAWDSVDWGTVTEVEAEAFSLVMLGNAMCQRWGVGEQIGLASLTGLDLQAQLDLVAGHIRDRSAARPDREMIKQQILVRHELMLHNGDLLQAYRPAPLRTTVPTTLFHATQGFLAPGNSNDLPAVPRTSDDKSNGLAGFVGPRITIHEMHADHHTIAHDDNLARIARMLSPVLASRNFPTSLFPASLNPAGPDGTR
ncbi:SAM-dependent methyltransferase [Streptomyces sp. DH24]|uniref:SDR family NAD(P)-dependent oxidoreductase n=1 Tax=Streptomyces sp. DH24 TaxID=3040123 RepID=UPI0024429592|nr:SAM-dependent methyltransferase [Streptomyces sp. DH24]MDG9715468.1 SDR family NAD(P)-dependent oxidoreductase [Streptomyces sp. DH24]